MDLKELFRKIIEIIERICFLIFDAETKNKVNDGE